MSTRIYLLLDIVNGNHERAMELLKSKPGVKLVDSLENSPDLIVVIQAPSSERLGEAIMPVIEGIDGIAENLKILVGKECSLAYGCNPGRGVESANIVSKRSGATNKPRDIARPKKEMAPA